MVVCCAADTANLLPGIELPLTRWKGRLSLLCEGALTDLKGAVTGPGYAIHSPDNWIGVGATYESAEKQMPLEEAHRKNLSHLTDLFPQLTEADAAGFYKGFRCVAPDRLPVVGQVPAAEGFPNATGIYVSCAMGSRGPCSMNLPLKSSQRKCLMSRFRWRPTFCVRLIRADFSKSLGKRSIVEPAVGS